MRNNKWRNKVGNPKRGWHSECLKHRHTHTHFKTDQTGKCRWHCRSMDAAVRGLNFNLPSDVQAKVLGDESNVIQWPYIHVVGFKSKWPIYIFIYTYMEYYSPMLLQMVKFYPSNSMDELERCLLSEIGQTEKDKYWILPFTVLFLKFLFLFEIILKQKVIF